MRKPKRKRTYVQRARQEQAEQTRARIVDAVVALHQEVGPRETTVAGIAARAGVQRLTVYRHFNDEAALFSACSHRFTELNPPPAPSAWSGPADPLERAAAALAAFYEHYGRTACMLAKIYRDAPGYPALQEIMAGFDAYLRQTADDLAASLAAPRKTARMKIALRHLIHFSTWQRLDAEGARDEEKLALALAWIEGLRGA